MAPASGVATVEDATHGARDGRVGGPGRGQLCEGGRMDLQTGRVYESRDEAIAAGVPAADLVEVERTTDGRYRLPADKVISSLGGNPWHQPHQGTREMARRAKRVAR